MLCTSSCPKIATLLQEPTNMKVCMPVPPPKLSTCLDGKQPKYIRRPGLPSRWIWAPILGKSQGLPAYAASKPWSQNLVDLVSKQKPQQTLATKFKVHTGECSCSHTCKYQIHSWVQVTLQSVAPGSPRETLVCTLSSDSLTENTSFCRDFSEGIELNISIPPKLITLGCLSVKCFISMRPSLLVDNKVITQSDCPFQPQDQFLQMHFCCTKDKTFCLTAYEEQFLHSQYIVSVWGNSTPQSILLEINGVVSFWPTLHTKEYYCEPLQETN